MADVMSCEKGDKIIAFSDKILVDLYWHSSPENLKLVHVEEEK